MGKVLIKTGIVAVLAIVSLIGFMVKLPRVFSAYDKELHGNFDPEDIMFNTEGLFMYSIIWTIWRISLTLKSK